MVKASTEVHRRPAPLARPRPPAHRRRQPAATLVRSLFAALLVAGAIGAAPRQEGPAAGVDPEQTPAFKLAVAELDALSKRQGLESRNEILLRDLSRYFVVYAVPETPDELQRVLGTVQRMSRQAGALFYRASRAYAQAAGAGTIRRSDVEATLQRLLPSHANDWNEVVYFPATTPTPLETWDLDAFLDTGLAWEVLGFLAQMEVAPAGPTLPLDEEASRALAQGVNAYGLLLLRLGGEHARAERAESLRADHLRAAGKTIADRASGEAAPIEAVPGNQPGRFFTDVTATVGPDFRHTTSDWLGRFRRYGPIAPSFSGGGAAAADVDGDDWPDLVLCGGHGCALFSNRQGRRFERIAAGIEVDGEARMPLLVDLDNDGDRDLVVTYARDTNRLFLNRGDGTFTDSTAGSGLEQAGDISGPITAFDADGDGDLDLVVGNFGDYLDGASAWVAPDAQNAQANRFYRNQLAERGSLSFVDDTERAGLGDHGWAQALSHLDYDGDGDQDVYVANDFGRNQLYANRGDGTFEAVGERTGSDDPYHGMNVSFADLNRDRLPDILVTNIWFWAAAKREVTETNSLLLSEHGSQGVVYRRASAPGLLGPDSSWAWAAQFFDLENDGDEDLYVANGFTDYMTFVQYRENPDHGGQLYPIHNARDANMLFLDAGGPGSVPDQLQGGTGAELAGLNSRAVVRIDYDRDGDLDLLVTTFHSHAHLLRNDAGSGHWLQLELEGDPSRGTNRDAIGAVVVATGPGDFYAWRASSGGEGYLGQNQPVIAIGTGAVERVDVEIDWPGGLRQSLPALATGRAWRVRQGEPPTPVARPVD